jgi:hypothetical protein
LRESFINLLTVCLDSSSKPDLYLNTTNAGITELLACQQFITSFLYNKKSITGYTYYALITRKRALAKPAVFQSIARQLWVFTVKVKSWVQQKKVA